MFSLQFYNEFFASCQRRYLKKREKRDKRRRWKRKDGIVSTSLKKAFQLSFLSVPFERAKQSDELRGSRCLEINCPHSEELFNESMQFPSGSQWSEEIIQWPAESGNFSDSNYHGWQRESARTWYKKQRMEWTDKLNESTEMVSRKHRFLWQ